jgi:hypothetical protein
MLRQTVNYTDYSGASVSDVYYFQMNRMDLLEFTAEFPDGDIQKGLQVYQDNSDLKGIYKLIKEIFELSFGVKSEDGKHFLKGGKPLEDFKNSLAYAELFEKAVTDTEFGQKFIKAILTAPDKITALTTTAEAYPTEEELDSATSSLSDSTSDAPSSSQNDLDSVQTPVSSESTAPVQPAG